MTLTRLLLLSLAITGCTSVELVAPGDYKSVEGKSIIVHTKDGRELTFSSGAYTVAEPGDSLLIRGRGLIRSIDGTRVDRSFAGVLTRTEIDRIETTKHTLMTYLLLYMLAGAIIGLSGRLGVW